jgi:hypothetical protein
MTKRDIEAGRLLYPEEVTARPAKRGDCESVPRPCPYVACRYNLFLDVSPRTGAIKLNFPDLEPDEMGESCALDVADDGGKTLEDLGEFMNVTRERLRQLEVAALGRLIAADALAREVADEKRFPCRAHQDEEPENFDSEPEETEL